MFIDESHVTLPQVRAMYKGDFSRKDALVSTGSAFLQPTTTDR